MEEVGAKMMAIVMILTMPLARAAKLETLGGPHLALVLPRPLRLPLLQRILSLRSPSHHCRGYWP